MLNMLFKRFFKDIVVTHAKANCMVTFSNHSCVVKRTEQRIKSLICVKYVCSHITKHLMSAPSGKIEFCFPSTLNESH